MDIPHLSKHRHIKFKFQPCEKYWFDNNPVKTLYANTITSSIPYGEMFLVLSVRPLLRKIKDKALRQKAIHFVKQEINHSREHYRLYRHAVRPFYPNLKVKKQLSFGLAQFIALFLGIKIRLGTIAAIEHFTAVTGELFLRQPELLAGMSEDLRVIWQWHFVEEIEHKAIAFDIFKEAKGNYATQVGGFLISSLVLVSGFANAFIRMGLYDKLFFKMSFYKDAWQFFWGKPGIFKQLMKPYFQFLRPNFHPSDTIDSNLLTKWQSLYLKFEDNIEN